MPLKVFYVTQHATSSPSLLISEGWGFSFLSFLFHFPPRRKQCSTWSASPFLPLVFICLRSFIEQQRIKCVNNCWLGKERFRVQYWKKEGGKKQVYVVLKQLLQRNPFRLYKDFFSWDTSLQYLSSPFKRLHIENWVCCQDSLDCST